MGLEGVVKLTDRITRIATLHSPISHALRNAALVFAGHLPPLTSALARNIAELEKTSEMETGTKIGRGMQASDRVLFHPQHSENSAKEKCELSSAKKLEV
jgi:hypothetical protein